MLVNAVEFFQRPVTTLPEIVTRNPVWTRTAPNAFARAGAVATLRCPSPPGLVANSPAPATAHVSVMFEAFTTTSVLTPNNAPSPITSPGVAAASAAFRPASSVTTTVAGVGQAAAPPIENDGVAASRGESGRCVSAQPASNVATMSTAATG